MGTGDAVLQAQIWIKWLIPPNTIFCLNGNPHQICAAVAYSYHVKTQKNTRVDPNKQGCHA